MIDAFKVPWAVLVLPYVPRARPLLARAPVLAAARARAWKMVERIILESEGLDPRKWWLGAKSCDHPEGDVEEEGRVWKPHHNFLWPTVAFGKGPGREGERQTLRFHLRPETLRQLRQGWAAVQNQILLAAEQNPIRYGQANVFYEFREEPEKKAHAARYFFRGFPKWPGKAQRVSGFGAFGCQVIKKLNETHAPASQEHDPALCWVCGEVVVYETYTPSRAYRTVSRGPAP